MIRLPSRQLEPLHCVCCIFYMLEGAGLNNVTKVRNSLGEFFAFLLLESDSDLVQLSEYTPNLFHVVYMEFRKVHYIVQVNQD